MKSLAPPYQNVVSVAYKPSSVIGGHLSRPIVTDGFKRNPESIDGPSQALFRFLLRAGFTSRTSRHAAGELLPHLSTLTWPGARRYLSVALVLKSPSAGVTRYSCPMEPGLSSRAAFRPAPAAVQLACAFILLNSVSLVNRSSATSKSCLGPHDEWQSYKRPSS